MSAYFVTGATGNQGGGAVNGLLAAGYKVHALVRNPTSAAALALEARGVILFKGSFQDSKSIEEAAAGCVGAFLNVSPVYTDLVNGELNDAKTTIAALRTTSVSHLIYASVLHTGRHASFPNWDNHPMQWYWLSKHGVETAVREAGFEKWTILRPGNFMTNYTPPVAGIMYPELYSRGIFKSGYYESTKINLVDPADVGAVAVKVFGDPEVWNGKEVDVVAEPWAISDAIRVLGEVVGREIAFEGFKEGEAEGFRAVLVQSQVALSEADASGEFGADLEELKGMEVKMRGWREFLEGKKAEGVLVIG